MGQTTLRACWFEHYAAQGKKLRYGVTVKQMKAGLDSCKVCERHVGLRHSTKSVENDNESPGQVLGLDFISLVNGVYLLVKLGYFTRMVQVEMCDKENAGQVIKGLKRWLSS